MFNPFKTNYKIQKEYLDGYPYFCVYKWGPFIGWVFETLSSDLNRSIQKVERKKAADKPITVWKDW